MTGYKLSICIPTYNRAWFLEKCLQSFIEQIREAKLEESVQIVISDNASIDNTEALVKSYQKKFDSICIVYHKNELNLGFDCNIKRIFDLAWGEFIWFFGDDDWVRPDAVAKVLGKIQSQSIDVMILNWVNYYPDGRISGKGLCFDKDQFYSSASEMLRIIKSTFFLSSLVFKKKLVKDPDLLDRYYSPKGFFHWGLFLNAASHSTNCAYMDHPIICHRIGNESYLSRWPEIFLNDMPGFLIDRAEELNISSKAIDSLLKEYLTKTSLLTILRVRVDFNRSNAELLLVLKKSKRFYKNYFRYYIYIIPAFFIPSILIKVLKKAYRYRMPHE